MDSHDGQAGDMARADAIGVLIDTIPTLVWRASADGAAEFFNRRWLDYTGLSPDEARGWKWSSTVHPEDLAGLVDTWRGILEAGQPGEAEARMRGADGQYRWFLLRAVPLRDEQGRITGWCGTNTDIEDRKRIENDLSGSKALLDETQRMARCGSVGLNLATGEVFWSDEGARIFGADPRTKPTVDLLLQRVHPDDRWLAQRSVERAYRGEPDTEFEIRLVLPDGSMRYVHAMSPAAAGTPGGPIFLRAVVDVTEAREAEAALQEAQAELARITRVTSLGELAASIAHEVLQPLSAVVTAGDASLRWLMRPTPVIEEVRDGLRDMIANARRASDIVRRVRSLSRKSEPERLTFDLNQMLEDVLVLIRGELVRRRVALRLELANGLPAIRGDRVQLQQVVINLVINGIQAMADIDPARVLSLRTKRHGDDQVVVEVQDSGPGIDPAITDRLFEPFFTTKPEGMGMGLAICRSIIAAHGGRLWFTRADTGTIFHFDLPRG